LLANITANTKLLSISFVEYLSGYKHNLQNIGEICQQHDIIFIVDSIQGVGAIPLDVQACHIDGLANGGHKWLMAPQGIGFLYVSQKLQNLINQSQMGWTGVEDFSNFLNYDQPPKASAGRYELGTLNFSGIEAANTSITLLREVGIQHIYKHLIEITDYAIEGLKEAGYKIYTNEKQKQRSGIVTFDAKGDSQELFDKLKANKIVCALRSDMIRISPHFYNNKDDIDKLLDVCRSY